MAMENQGSSFFPQFPTISQQNTNEKENIERNVQTIISADKKTVITTVKTRRNIPKEYNESWNQIRSYSPTHNNSNTFNSQQSFDNQSLKPNAILKRRKIIRRIIRKSKSPERITIDQQDINKEDFNQKELNEQESLNEAKDNEMSIVQQSQLNNIGGQFNRSKMQEFDFSQGKKAYDLALEQLEYKLYEYDTIYFN